MYIDPKIHQGLLKGHTDAVWDLVVHRDRDLLATSSADGTCKIWNWRSSHDPVMSLSADPGIYTYVTYSVNCVWNFSRLWGTYLSRFC